MKTGIIFCGWGTRDLVERSLSPWVELRRQGKCVICAVSVRFAGFEGDDDGTREYLRGALERGDIDHLIDGPDNIAETTARGMCLTFLRRQKCDLIIQWDNDECSDVESISKMLDYVSSNPWIQWFRFSYRNLVFDERTWLAEPFTPPRVHRVIASDGYFAHSFSGDNDICYGHHILRNLIPQEAYSHQTIPPTVFSPLHFSWLNNERSRQKVMYQRLRWGCCSFKWEDGKGLSFDVEYFAKRGEMTPKIVYLNDNAQERTTKT